MQVVNMSFGGSGFSQALSDICDKANNSGILLIAAAGNSGGSPGQETIGYPAKFPSCMAIAATDSNDARASFSSVGLELSVAAPGVSIPSTVPKQGNSCCSDPSGYKNLSGTSMATPHTVGTAVLVMKAHPDMTNSQVRKAIENTAVDLGQPGHDDLYGWGRIDALAATGATPPPPGQLTTISISPATLTIIVGNTGQLSATCKDQNGNTITCPTLTWNSDNTSAATVDSTGLVKAIAQGTANITASSGSVTSSKSTITVSSEKPVLATITISPGNSTIIVGNTLQLSATCKDQNGNTITCPTLTWNSDNTSAATVDSTGLVKAIAQGTAHVSASAGNVTSNISTITVTSPTPTGKFTVQIAGNAAFVFKSPFGDKTADEACAAVCAAIKNM